MTTQVDVNRALSEMRDSYPNLFVEDADQWRRRVSSYHRRLRGFDARVVDEACVRAAAAHPDRFPTAGQLVDISKTVTREHIERRDKDEAIERRKAQDRLDHETVMERREMVIPDTPEEQQKWCAQGKTPLHTIARCWEVESKMRGFHPNKQVPDDVGRRRWGEFWQAFDKMTADKVMPEVRVAPDDLPFVDDPPEPGWNG